MNLKIGVLMDAIETIKPYKDSTFAMMLSAQSRGHELYYFQQHDLFIEQGKAYASSQGINVIDKDDDYYRLTKKQTTELSQFDAILMRKDPPFDLEFVYTTYILEMAERDGTMIVNPPNALRNINEKFSIAGFPDLTPKTTISRDINIIRAFIKTEGSAVVKPLDGMGGAGIFKVSKDDPNTNSILESLGNGKNTLMVQKYMDKVTEGDKRILLVDGESPQHSLARMPQGVDFRANMAVGGIGVPKPLTQREREICAKIRPWIKRMRLTLVGLDVIDGCITEINVTSPTGMREIQKGTGEDIADRFIAAIETQAAQYLLGR